MNGKVIVPLIYDYIYRFGSQLLVSLDDKCGIVVLKNNVIIPIEYNSIYMMKDGNL
jgi:hypothetical protein